MYLDQIWTKDKLVWPRKVRGAPLGVAPVEQGPGSACAAASDARGIALLGDGAMCGARARTDTSERMRALGLGPRVNLGDDEQLA